MAESELYLYLKSRYKEIYCQPKIYLTRAKILYKPDFFCEGVYFEMKGAETAPWKLKKRLWEAGYGPGPLHIYKMKRGKVELQEMITPLPVDASLS